MRSSNILPLSSPNSARGASSGSNGARGYSSPMRVARMGTSPRNDIAPRPPPQAGSSGEYATPRRHDHSVGGGSGGSILPVLTSPAAHAQVPPLRTPSPSAFKRTVWTTPRSPRESSTGSPSPSTSNTNDDGRQTPPRRNSTSYEDDQQCAYGFDEDGDGDNSSTSSSTLLTRLRRGGGEISDTIAPRVVDGVEDPQSDQAAGDVVDPITIPIPEESVVEVEQLEANPEQIQEALPPAQLSNPQEESEVVPGAEEEAAAVSTADSNVTEQVPDPNQEAAVTVVSDEFLVVDASEARECAVRADRVAETECDDASDLPPGRSSNGEDVVVFLCATSESEATSKCADEDETNETLRLPVESSVNDGEQFRCDAEEQQQSNPVDPPPREKLSVERLAASNMVARVVHKGLHHLVVLHLENRRYAIKTFVLTAFQGAIQSIVGQRRSQEAPGTLDDREELPPAKAHEREDGVQEVEADAGQSSEGEVEQPGVIQSSSSFDGDPSSEAHCREEGLVESGAEREHLDSRTPDGGDGDQQSYHVKELEQEPVVSQHPSASASSSDPQDLINPVHAADYAETEGAAVPTPPSGQASQEAAEAETPVVESADAEAATALGEREPATADQEDEKTAPADSPETKTFAEEFVLNVQNEAVASILADQRPHHQHFEENDPPIAVEPEESASAPTSNAATPTESAQPEFNAVEFIAAVEAEAIAFVTKSVMMEQQMSSEAGGESGDMAEGGDGELSENRGSDGASPAEKENEVEESDSALELVSSDSTTASQPPDIPGLSRDGAAEPCETSVVPAQANGDVPEKGIASVDALCLAAEANIQSARELDTSETVLNEEECPSARGARLGDGAGDSAAELAQFRVNDVEKVDADGVTFEAALGPEVGDSVAGLGDASEDHDMKKSSADLAAVEAPPPAAEREKSWQVSDVAGVSLKLSLEVTASALETYAASLLNGFDSVVTGDRGVNAAVDVPAMCGSGASQDGAEEVEAAESPLTEAAADAECTAEKDALTDPLANGVSGKLQDQEISGFQAENSSEEQLKADATRQQESSTVDSRYTSVVRPNSSHEEVCENESATQYALEGAVNRLAITQASRASSLNDVFRDDSLPTTRAQMNKADESQVAESETKVAEKSDCCAHVLSEPTAIPADTPDASTDSDAVDPTSDTGATLESEPTMDETSNAVAVPTGDGACSTPTPAAEPESPPAKTVSKVTWDLPPKSEREKTTPSPPPKSRRTERRRTSSRLLEQSQHARSEMMCDPTLTAYDAHREQGQPFALLDDNIFSIDPDARHMQHDENDNAKCTESEIRAKRKNFDQDNHRKSIAFRSIPAFNYAPVLIRFQWSDFVVATPIMCNPIDSSDKKSWNPASPVKKMRLLAKKGIKLPCGSYVIVSAFIRPLEDGNENLRIHIYDSEWVEEFQYDFSEDHLKEYMHEWTGCDEEARLFMTQLEFRRKEGGIIIKLPDKIGQEEETRPITAPAVAMPLPDGKEHPHHDHTSPQPPHRNSRHSHRPSTSPHGSFLPIQTHSLPNLSDTSKSERRQFSADDSDATM